PTALWRGVTGFYLPYCSQCHPDPMTTVQVVLTWLPEDARVQAPNRLPFAIRPAPGWFDGRMLLAAHLARPAAWHGSSIWKLWPHSGAPDSAPALVCVGPMGPDLSNLLFLHDAKRDLPELRRVLLQWSPELPNDLALPYRTGTADELQALAGGICSAPPPRGLVVKLIPGGLTRAQAPIAWGGYAIEEPGCPVSIGVTRNMREALRDARAHGLLHDGKSQATLYHWPVREGVIAFRDLRRLGTWLSTSKGGAGSSRLGE
ncbi:MAG: hypothetical protein ACRC1H_11615, partial [Caldilineaceae bacterium]